MIADCFIFNNEWDILEIRFEELYPVVDYFVICEGDLTLSGRPKELHFLKEGFKRFPQYANKFHCRSLDMQQHAGLDAWSREEIQRNNLAKGVDWFAPDDIILLSDADEIPRRSTVEQLDGTPVSLVFDKFMYGLNVLTTEKHGSTKVFPRSLLDTYTPHDIRKQTIEPYIQNAGWEFSSFGTPAQVQEKLASFAHTEFNTPEHNDLDIIRHRMDNLIDVVGRDDALVVVDIDDTWPEAVKNNPERWKDFVW